MRPQSFLPTIGFMFVVAITSFVLGEMVVRQYARHNLIYDLEMSRYSQALKQDSPDPRIGHTHRPNSRANLMGVDVIINSDGFRDDDYNKQRGNKARVVLLGDSFTLGWGVHKEATFADILERKLEPSTEVINLGTGNYNTEQEVYFFEQKGLAYAPDQVVVFYFLNDAEPTPTTSTWEILQRSQSITLFWSVGRQLLNRITGAMDYREYYKSLYQSEQRGWINAQRAFLRLQLICRQHRIMLKVILLPELHDLKDYPFVTEHQRIASFLDEHAIPYIDLTPQFRHIGDSPSLWVAPDDAHPNALAHRLIANYSISFISAQH